MSRGPGTAQGYYRGDTFLYRVKCAGYARIRGDLAWTDCGWVGYRVYFGWLPCPRCGGQIC